MNIVSSKTLQSILSVKGELSDLHHSKLKSQVQIEEFEVIFDDILANTYIGEIIDFSVLGV